MATRGCGCLGDGDTAPSNHLTNGGDTSAVRVKTARGDSLLAQGYGPPAVIKIDVEGFEGEVLDGMELPCSLLILAPCCLR